MSRYIGPNCKKCRALSQKMLLKGARCVSPKCAVERNKQSPGQHGVENKKMSVYAEHLREKQRVKFTYGINEAQMRINFARAEKQKGATGENFLSVLESRLDNVVYRLGLAESRPQARQFIRHGKILINGKKNGIPSFVVKEGQVISVVEKFKQNAAFLRVREMTKSLARPQYAAFDPEKMEGKMLRMPLRSDLDSTITEQLLVEYYSR